MLLIELQVLIPIEKLCFIFVDEYIAVEKIREYTPLGTFLYLNCISYKLCLDPIFVIY